MRTEIGFSGKPGHGKTDPESDAEELLELKTSEGSGGKEKAHHWPSGGDSEQDGDGAHHPDAMKGEVVLAEEEGGAAQREQEEAVVKDGGTCLDEASDWMEAEEQRSCADDAAEEQQSIGDAPVQDGVVSDAAQEPERQERDEDERWNNVAERQCFARGKDQIKSGIRLLRRGDAGRVDEGNDSPDGRSGGDKT